MAQKLTRDRGTFAASLVFSHLEVPHKILHRSRNRTHVQSSIVEVVTSHQPIFMHELVNHGGLSVAEQSDF